MPDDLRIASLGQALGPDVIAVCKDAYFAEQGALADAMPAIARDIAYGPHRRQVHDIYGSAQPSRPVPVIVFIHGGGFVRGDKGGGDDWFNAHVGRWAACNGALGVVANYRLAPEHSFPAGAQDVAALIDHLRANIGRHGGDPRKLILMGTSAGAAHVAGYLALRNAAAKDEIAGAVLLSGLYGHTSADPADLAYFGSQEDYENASPRRALAATDVPLFVACAGNDPVRFQREYLGLLSDRLDHHGTVPDCFVGHGHNHYTLAMHLGTSDSRLSDAVLGFVARCGEQRHA